MSIPHTAGAPPGQQPEHGPGVDNVVAFPHQPDGDFFDLTPNPVVDRELVKVSEFPQGTTIEEVVTLANGRHYEAVSGVPAEKRTDVKVVEGTALGTSIHGHNFYNLLQVMDEGFEGTLIGPEGGHAKWLAALKDPVGFAKNLASISIWETAGNMHEILNALEESPPDERQPVVKLGESRDAAIAFGFAARADEFDREVIFTDAIAACFAEGKPLTLSPNLIPRAGEVFGQIGSLAWHSARMNLAHPRRALHYARTVNPNPYFLLHVAATVPTLVSGQAGELARRVDADARMYLTHFTGDPWAEPPDWLELFKDHELITHDERPGDHGGIAKAETQRDRRARVGRLGHELATNRDDIERIDWERVYTGGQLAVAAA